MNRVVVLLAGLLVAPAAFATPARVILIRHAEKPPEESNAHLSAQGRARAEALPKFFTSASGVTNNGLPELLFATHPAPHSHSLRPRETLEPTAKRLGLRIETTYAATEFASLARHLLTHRSCDGKVVVVCWVHDDLAGLAAALGVRPKPDAWKGHIFDRAWVITWPGGKARLEEIPQRVLPGDSKH